jgi:molybdopterin synthase sulfur carrier subunit
VPCVRFTANLRRHCGDLPEIAVPGATLRAALEATFTRYPAVRSYVLDDQGGVRKHVSIFVDDQQILDRTTLADAVGPHSTIDLYQALSGG